MPGHVARKAHCKGIEDFACRMIRLTVCDLRSMSRFRVECAKEFLHSESFEDICLPVNVEPNALREKISLLLKERKTVDLK